MGKDKLVCPTPVITKCLSDSQVILTEWPVSYTHLDVYKRQVEDVKAFIRQDTTAKFDMLEGELNKHVDRILEIENSV